MKRSWRPEGIKLSVVGADEQKTSGRDHERGIHVPARLELPEKRTVAAQRVNMVVLRAEIEPAFRVFDRTAVNAKFRCARSSDRKPKPHATVVGLERHQTGRGPVGSDEDGPVSSNRKSAAHVPAHVPPPTYF